AVGQRIAPLGRYESAGTARGTGVLEVRRIDDVGDDDEGHVRIDDRVGHIGDGNGADLNPVVDREAVRERGRHRDLVRRRAVPHHIRDRGELAERRVDAGESRAGKEAAVAVVKIGLSTRPLGLEALHRRAIGVDFSAGTPPYSDGDVRLLGRAGNQIRTIAAQGVGDVEAAVATIYGGAASAEIHSDAA